MVESFDTRSLHKAQTRVRILVIPALANSAVFDTGLDIDEAVVCCLIGSAAVECFGGE
jgi:hypothetical protein